MKCSIIKILAIFIIAKSNVNNHQVKSMNLMEFLFIQKKKEI